MPIGSRTAVKISSSFPAVGKRANRSPAVIRRDHPQMNG
jgi:hypothetical protein